MEEFLRHVQAAVGYMELGMFDDAVNELESLEPDYKMRPAVLEVRLEIYSRLERWVEMATIAKYLVDHYPDDPDWSLKLAYATRREKSLQEAEAILLTAAEKFPNDATIQFNLGCYACQLGKITEAKRRVKRAIDLDKTLRVIALEDSDLEPMWDSLGDEVKS